MARYFQIYAKVARAAIALLSFAAGQVNTWTFYLQSRMFLASNTQELIEKLDSLSIALKYAKVKFYTLKSLIESGNSYQGKIYSYKDKL